MINDYSSMACVIMSKPPPTPPSARACPCGIFGFARLPNRFPIKQAGVLSSTLALGQTRARAGVVEAATVAASGGAEEAGALHLSDIFDNSAVEVHRLKTLTR